LFASGDNDVMVTEDPVHPTRAKTPPAARWRAARVLALLCLALGTLLALPAASAHASDYTAGNLPDWAIGPFTRQPQPSPAPVLTASPASSWESQHVLNPGVVYRNNQFDMLYRADGGNPDQIGLATSTNGITFTRSPSNPVITNNVDPQESGGVTDPRLYELNGTYYSFISGYDWSNSPPQTIMETTSTDLVHWTTAVPIISTNYDPAVVTDGNDTPVLMSTQYGPRYVMYYGDADPAKGRFIAYSTDMLHWGNITPFSMDFPSDYAPWEICVTVTNYQTAAGGPVNHNVVMFVAGTLMAHGRWYYGISEVEFSASDPTQQLGQLTEAALSPAQPYELSGRTANTVFMNSILFHNGQWSMYYGAADTAIGLATAPLRASAQAPFTSTGFEAGQRYPDWADVVDSGGGQSGGIAGVSPYPGYGLTGPETSMRSETAHGGTTALLYSGDATGAAADYAYTKVFDLSAHPPAIDAGTTLSYWIYPQGPAASTCVALDMVFADGTALRNLGATDQNGDRLHPASQCGHLAVGQWNHVTASIGAVAAGKTPARIDLGFDEPGGSGTYRGYVDDISLAG
jgi:predicted GH43/DUF377 family glycosyl hydrolase